MKFSLKFLQRLSNLEVSIDDEQEAISEHIAQYRSEVAMFGDGGPGSHPSLIDYTYLNSNIAELAALRGSAGGKVFATFEQLSNTLSITYYNAEAV